MNTNSIKSFAKEARLLLLDGVFQRLKYWGFQEDGSNTESLQTTQGGYIFRTKPYTDTTVPSKWGKLKSKLINEQDVKDVVEEASYTWFNRLMAIKILESNGYIAKQLAYTTGSRTPLIVQNAKRGEHSITNTAEKELLIEYLKEDRDEEAFALLITNLCHTNTLLHDIFGRIDDYTEILFPQHVLQINGLLDLINSDAISEDDYKEVELIGWLYQFYISDKKDEVFAGFKKNKKARAEDIPAATQIFTPKWIVKYMVENTVGKIYLDYEPDSDLRDQMKYLVENESDSAVSSSAVENNSNLSPRAQSRGLIKDLTQLTLIDPAAGSGHILVTGFELLFKMYKEEGYTSKQAVQHILQHNLFGLDIDDRAMQLARFAVLLKAGQYDATILQEPIMPHIYSFPEDTLGNWFTQTYYSKSQSNWSDLLGMQLAEPVTIEWEETIKNKTKAKKATFKKGDVLNQAILDLLNSHCNEPIAVDYAQELELFWGDKEKPWDYSEFFYAINLLRQGKNLGSAIKLNISNEVYTHLKEQYQNWLIREQTADLPIDELGVFNLLKPFLEVLFVLANQYKAVVANPPYLKSENFNSELRKYSSEYYPTSKANLSNIFLLVCSSLTKDSAKTSMINQQGWMFLSSLGSLRKKLFESNKINSLLHLGANVFDISGEVVQSVAFIMDKNLVNIKSSFYKLNNINNPEEKRKAFLNKNNCYVIGDFNKLSVIEGNPISYWLTDNSLDLFSKEENLEELVEIRSGISTGKNDLYYKYWFEINHSNIEKEADESFTLNNKLESKKKWFYALKGGENRKWFGNREDVINLKNDGYDIRNSGRNFRLRSRDQYHKKGITWSRLSSNKISFRIKSNETNFGENSPSIFLEDNFDMWYMIGLLNSKPILYLISAINPTLSFQKTDVNKLPIIIKQNKHVGALSESCFQISRTDWDSRETSWDFKKSPLLNKTNSLEKAYQEWNNKVTTDFFQLHSNEEELNRIFIDIYGLQEELTPEVALKDITILQEELNGKDLEALEPTFREHGQEAISLPINKGEVLSQFVSYAIGIFLGRYRLDKPGLNIAHPNPTEEELASYNVIARNEAISRKITIDEDGIVPLMGEDCAFPDDALTRTKDLLLTIWGENALTENINFLQECLGMDLHKWLTEKFWGYHTKMYKKKPIYWLFCSNVKKPQQSAFKVLVYMHRMDKYTVQQIQRSYLYPHQEYIKNEIDKLVQDEDSLNRDQQKRLELLRNWELECRDYNEVLKTLANQQIEIDLDDGVTVNYTKFEGAVAKI
ncbi:MAG: BREX-1 system adenine-specific DNA-methyltransferase PglX [Deltaproteobacteria bacterium]|nr:BREX-1 system adenine-specific DNA-methyltransferase PglX [Deltaproteobacteria bacterium]